MIFSIKIECLTIFIINNIVTGFYYKNALETIFIVKMHLQKSFTLKIASTNGFRNKKYFGQLILL